jgi:hypothetical protein
VADTATLKVSSDSGGTFSSTIDFGPLAASATGVLTGYYYDANPGLQEAQLFVTPVDLSDFGILTGTAINAINITGSPQLDLIRVAGLNTSAVPEPATMLLLGFGLVGLAGVRRFKK